MTPRTNIATKVAGALALAALGIVAFGTGCRRAPSAYYEDPGGRFSILPFQPTEDGVDATGTAFRHARIDVALPDGAVQRVAWQAEEYADGSPDNWKWTLVDEKTGARRVYTSSSTWRRASVSDGVETHTTTAVRGRGTQVSLDQTVYPTFDAACRALAATPLGAATPYVFGAVRKALLHGISGPRNSSVYLIPAGLGCP